MPCHHTLEEYLDSYIRAAGIGEDKKGPLFRSALERLTKPSAKAGQFEVCGALKGSC
jgi:integrase/recombinase XerD